MNKDEFTSYSIMPDAYEINLIILEGKNKDPDHNEIGSSHITPPPKITIQNSHKITFKISFLYINIMKINNDSEKKTSFTVDKLLQRFNQHL